MEIEAGGGPGEIGQMDSQGEEKENQQAFERIKVVRHFGLPLGFKIDSRTGVWLFA